MIGFAALEHVFQVGHFPGETVCQAEQFGVVDQTPFMQEQEGLDDALGGGCQIGVIARADVGALNVNVGVGIDAPVDLRLASDADARQVGQHPQEPALTLLEMPEGGTSGALGGGAGGAFRLRQKMHRQTRPGGDHAFDRQPVFPGLLGRQVGLDHAPGLAVIGHEDGARIGCDAVQGGLAVLAFLLAHEGGFDLVQESLAVAVQADAVFEPGGIARQPAQQRSQVRFAVQGADRLVDGVMAHHRGERQAFAPGGRFLPGDPLMPFRFARARVLAEAQSPVRCRSRRCGWIGSGWRGWRADSSSRTGRWR